MDGAYLQLTIKTFCTTSILIRAAISKRPLFSMATFPRVMVLVRMTTREFHLLMEIMPPSCCWRRLDANNEQRINRSFGSNIRASDSVAQDDKTGAVTEVLVVRMPPLTTSLEEWMETVQAKLSDMTSGEMRIFGRLEMPQKRFSAEQDVSHVRVEYLLPADFLCTGSSSEQERLDFFNSLLNFHAGQARDQHVQPSPESLKHLIQLKQLRRLFTTKIVDLDTSDPSAVMEKEFHVQRRKRHRKKQQDKRREKHEHAIRTTHYEQQNEKEEASSTAANENDESFHDNVPKSNNKKTHGKKTKVLQRRRFHNFTPRVMAHEFLSFRRLDRFYHCVTLRIDEKQEALCGPFLDGRHVSSRTSGSYHWSVVGLGERID